MKVIVASGADELIQGKFVIEAASWGRVLISIKDI